MIFFLPVVPDSRQSRQQTLEDGARNTSVKLPTREIENPSLKLAQSDRRAATPA
jgi:hypothetical protein